MQRYTDITENHTVEESRQLLLDNDMTALTCNSGVEFPSYGTSGIMCFRSDQNRLFIKRSDGVWQLIADPAQTHISSEEANARFSAITHNHDAVYVPKVSTARPGVTKLYRSDTDSGFNVQINWTGTYWRLYGFNGDAEHAGVMVAKASNADYAENANNLDGLSSASFLRSNASDTYSGYRLTCTNHMTINGSLTVGGDVTSSSDARLKSEIKTIEDALGMVNKMRGVRYLHNKTSRRNVGFVAQELKEVLPEVVVEDENKMLSVAYGNVTALLVEAVKELTDRVSQLEGAA